MAKIRDNAGTLRRRNELAKERGFTGYSQQRRIMSNWKSSKIAKQTKHAKKAKVTDPDEVKLAKLMEEAFKPGNEDDYSLGSPKSEFFIMLGYVADEDEWSRRYPKGIREYNIRAA